LLDELKAIIDGPGSLGARANTAVMLIVQTVGCERGWLVMVDGRSLITVGGVGMVLADPLHTPLPIDKGVVGRCAREGRVLRIDDVRKSTDYYAATALTRSELAVPVRNEKGTVVGVMNCEANRVEAFGDEEQRMIEEAAPLLSRLIPAVV
jgi:putative methionine-R-sulfoxide reductase with GAF domain